jgi:hypothetical protein
MQKPVLKMDLSPWRTRLLPVKLEILWHCQCHLLNAKRQNVAKQTLKQISVGMIESPGSRRKTG